MAFSVIKILVLAIEYFRSGLSVSLYVFFSKRWAKIGIVVPIIVGRLRKNDFLSVVAAGVISFTLFHSFDCRNQLLCRRLNLSHLMKRFNGILNLMEKFTILRVFIILEMLSKSGIQILIKQIVINDSRFFLIAVRKTCGERGFKFAGLYV